MAQRSRVELYAELRKKIDAMALYSFDSSSLSSHEEPKSQISKSPTNIEEATITPTPLDVQEAHVKKNTLSISIGDLIKAHEDYTTSISKSDIANELKPKKIAKDKKDKKIPLVYWVIGASILIFLLIIILVSVL